MASQPHHTSDAVHKPWWKEATVYQIYPSSFKDSNGDGIGDIPGIISKLDYIQALGVELVWLCPIFTSPQVDMGYDVSDYRDIHPPYGTLADVDLLIKGLKSRGMKLIMDLVVNHTSDQHMWFIEAKKSKHNRYRNYYIWREPRYDVKGNRLPPNNWAGIFGGSAWEYDEPSNEYYLHLFARQQPDLNWENDDVRAEVHAIMRFWLEKGIGGFRMDVINFISKTPGLPDAKVVDLTKDFHHGSEHSACGPRLHEWLREMGKILKEYNAFSVGEMPCVTDMDQVLSAVKSECGELNMVIHFQIMELDTWMGKFTPTEWKMSDLKSIVSLWQNKMFDDGGWNALYLENHDQSRSVSRWGSDAPESRVVCAKMFATFLALQGGTLFVYQGQELGMINVPKDWNISEYHDLETNNHWDEILSKHPINEALRKITLEEMQKKARDNGRTPMQWDDSKHGGFSTAKPWQRVNDSYDTINAAAQVGVKGSVFSYWAEIIKLRKQHKDVFVHGDYALIEAANDDVFAYTRMSGTETVLVVTNFRPRDVTLSLGSVHDFKSDEVLISNYGDVRVEGELVKLRPFEAFACPISHRPRVGGVESQTGGATSYAGETPPHTEHDEPFVGQAASILDVFWAFLRRCRRLLCC